MKTLFYWMTDIHMNFLVNPGVKRKFLNKVQKLKAPIVITGDISDGLRLYTNLKELAEASEFPIYFITGNHDYYHSSFDRTDKIIRTSVSEHDNLIYLPHNGIVPLSETTCLIGPESWYDGKIIPFVVNINFSMNDFNYIEDLCLTSKQEIANVFQARASEGLEKLKELTEQAKKKYKNIIVLSHPIPFGCMDGHKGSELSPFYVWYEGGKYISDFAFLNPDTNILWLSGHTHGRGVFENFNLKAYSLESEYSFPKIGASIGTDLSITFLNDKK